MKREFLQGLMVGDQPLSKEVIDAVMAENGRDIQAAKDAVQKSYADYETLKQELERLRSETTAEGKTALQWKQELEQVKWDHLLHSAVASAGGRNVTAIRALLDTQSLSQSEDPEKALKAALEDLKKECGYLFEEKQIPPVYAAGTGTDRIGYRQTENSLAGALREKFERK
ncbi:MAG: phage scaffolding protein [Oscillospiraceae bacterium]|nr:phage scaffolding protein [Oscillospiraceae bacterium]